MGAGVGDGRRQTTTLVTIPGGGGSQTPWTSDIDAAAHKLNNVGGIAVGSGGSGSSGMSVAGPGFFDSVNQTNGSSNGWAGVSFANDLSHALALRVYGSARANPDISRLESTAPFAIVMNNVERARMTVAGNFGIANAAPAYALDVTGDVNTTGVYRVNGVPISTGGGAQTPWTSDIDAASFALNNVSWLGVGATPTKMRTRST